MADHFVNTWPFFNIYVERGWASFGWYAIQFPRPVYVVILALMALAFVLALAAARRERQWVRRHWLELLILVLTPLGVVAAVESAFSTPVMRPVLAEMGRYAFPAISALAVLTVAATFGAGRRRAVVLATSLVAAEMVIAYASVLLTLRGFYT
jgi:hypothetical protein